MLVAVGMYLPLATTGAIFLGGCLKALVEWRVRRKGVAGESATRVESVGTLAASGLIAGESLTGVVLAGLVLASERFTSIAAALGLPPLTFVDGPAGAWIALAPLAALVWLLVRVPLRDATRARAEA
jgi:hypothetical protein